MRWQATSAPSRFDGQIAATPVTLLSREEDAAFQGSKLAASCSRRAFPSKTAIRTPALPTRLPDHQRRLTIASRSDTIRLSTTVVAAPQALQPVARVLTPRAEDPQHDAPLADDAHTKFLVCAGRALNAESPRNNNNEEEEEQEEEVSSTKPTPSYAHATPRSQRGLQRSNSELELIISELREKITLQHRSSQPPRPEEDDACGSHHSRKHLKNPIEKMSLVSSPATSGQQLRRQAPTNHEAATRLVREGSATMVMPVVLSSSVSRSSVLPTNGGGVSVHSLSLKEDAKKDGVASSEPTASSEGFRIRAYATNPESHTMPSSVFTSSTLLGQKLPLFKETPTHASVERLSTKPRVRTLVDLDLELDRPDTCDGDRGDLSPVGPWDIDCNPPDSLTSPRSTCSVLTSSPTGDLVLPTPAASELSPRSRLLWLSDCSSETGGGSTSHGYYIHDNTGKVPRYVGKSIARVSPTTAYRRYKRPSRIDESEAPDHKAYSAATTERE